MNTDAWRAWAEQLTTGLAWVGADLRVQWINVALAELLGVGTRGVVGQSLAVLLREPAGMAAARRALTGQHTMQLRSALLSVADGADIGVDLTLQPFDTGVLLEVHALAPEAVGASPLSGTLRGFAHEMKNPLAGMRGAAQLLQRRVEDGELRALAGLVIDEADRLTALANRLLHHTGPAQLGAVNIHQLLERVVELLRAEPSPPVMHFDYDPSTPEVWADADRLQQVLLNLARNAAQAGASTLTLRTRVEHAVRLSEQVQRSALRVDVMDDGPGIAEAVRDSLFQPLVSGRADGVGLGLALSRELAREHGGDLRCTSRPGATVFSLYLPLGTAHA
ncbi:MAG TPA: ATP-binding protein [Rhodanobacter sp.]|nr:ATP-binding protein [Rhodanobacter sp.]